MSNYTEQMTSFKENNDRFWLDMTKKGTLIYCYEMLKLSIEFQRSRPDDMPYDKYLESLDDKIFSYMDLVNEYSRQNRWDEIRDSDSPFPEDLHGYIHEYDQQQCKFQPNHLMCKLAVLRDEKRKFNYEFLIEYDIFETDVEIYFGVKAVSDSWQTSSEFQDMVLKDWSQTVKVKGRYKTNAHRFKMTNNGNNGTFWPFWWRLGMDCKEALPDALQIVVKFYKDYKEFLELKDVFTPKFDRVGQELENSLLNEKDWDLLLTRIDKDYKTNSDDETKASELFKGLMDKCVEKELIRRVEGEGVKYITIGPVVKITVIIRRFFELLSVGNSEWQTSHTPIEHLSKVILDKHARVIKSANWRKHSEQVNELWNQAFDDLLDWFPELKKHANQRCRK